MWNPSAAARAAAASGLLLILIVAAVVGDYAISGWRADQAVARSQSYLCQIVELVTAHPVQYPADPAKNPSRVQSYVFYEAFVTLGRRYSCQPPR